MEQKTNEVDKTDQNLVKLAQIATKRKANEGANSKSKKKRRRAAKVARASRKQNR